MRLVISVAVLVASALASPYGDITVAQAQESCGDHQTVSCCNKSSSDGNNGGALSGLLDNGLLGECAKLDVALTGDEPLDDNCDGQVACCKDDNSGALIALSCDPIDV